jgi:hypothetical protein
LCALIRRFPRIIHYATDTLPAPGSFDFATERLFISWLLFNERVLREINAISAHCAWEINAIVDNTYPAMTGM